MKSFILHIGLILTILLSSCFKEELPVPRKDRGDVVTETVEMGPTYDKRFYISLGLNSVTGTIDKHSWDIALSGDSANPYIRLNTALGMMAYNTGKTSLMEVTDTSGLLTNPLIDFPRGDKDSLALSGILDSGYVYLIYLGTDASLQSNGYLVLKAFVAEGQYQLHYRFYNQSTETSKKINFNSKKQHVLYSFKKELVLEEPDMENWDFQLTQYQHVYYNPFQTYSVVGCLINPKRVEASIYKGSKSFADIDQSDAIAATYSSKEDHIGFGWKYYDLNNNKYVIRPEKCYFIRYANGQVFKLHFIGFYNSKGEKGTPVFEYKEL